MDNINKLFGSLLKWVDWLLVFARVYANYLAVGIVLVMASKLLKLKVNYGGGK